MSAWNLAERLNLVLACYADYGLDVGIHPADRHLRCSLPFRVEETVTLCRTLKKDGFLDHRNGRRLTGREGGAYWYNSVGEEDFYIINSAGLEFLRKGGYEMETVMRSPNTGVMGASHLRPDGSLRDSTMPPITTKTNPASTKRKMLTGLWMWTEENPFGAIIVGGLFAVAFVFLGVWADHEWDRWFPKN
jgi:hypothetical protein